MSRNHGATICPYCQKRFNRTRGWQKFCTKVCRLDHWNKLHPRIDLTKVEDKPKTEAT